MRDWVKRYYVSNLSKIDTTQYLDGDVFITNQSIGMLHDGKVKTMKGADLSNYPTKDEVQTMINNATSGGGGQ